MPSLWRVVRAFSETRDTFTLVLAPTDSDAAPFRFEPGQFNMIWAFGLGEVPISISGHAGSKREVVHTIRAVGGVTQSLQKLKKDDVLAMRGPFGTPWPVASARGHDVVIVAGGIGLAPLRPVIYHLLEHRAQFDRVLIVYGARSPDELLFRRELETWRGRFDLDVQVTVDRGAADWHGHVGVVTTLLPRGHFDPDETAAFLCGPEAMMTFASRELEKRGVSRDKIWISMERNMKCGVGLCGHCQLGPSFVCKDGPVYRLDQVASLLAVREL
jgi:NAD(P)H-flavin reductase